jgi:hypothetical protein
MYLYAATAVQRGDTPFFDEIRGAHEKMDEGAPEEPK